MGKKKKKKNKGKPQGNKSPKKSKADYREVVVHSPEFQD